MQVLRYPFVYSNRWSATYSYAISNISEQNVCEHLRISTRLAVWTPIGSVGKKIIVGYSVLADPVKIQYVAL
jgi:multidrug transporter EmrE-like cation transporter